MCIRDRLECGQQPRQVQATIGGDVPGRLFRNCELRAEGQLCLLYTSDAADDLLCVDLGGRRIIKKNNIIELYFTDF